MNEDDELEALQEVINSLYWIGIELIKKEASK